MLRALTGCALAATAACALSQPVWLVDLKTGKADWEPGGAPSGFVKISDSPPTYRVAPGTEVVVKVTNANLVRYRYALTGTMYAGIAAPPTGYFEARVDSPPAVPADRQSLFGGASALVTTVADRSGQLAKALQDAQSQIAGVLDGLRGGKRTEPFAVSMEQLDAWCDQLAATHNLAELAEIQSSLEKARETYSQEFPNAPIDTRAAAWFDDTARWLSATEHSLPRCLDELRTEGLKLLGCQTVASRVTMGTQPLDVELGAMRNDGAPEALSPPNPLLRLVPPKGRSSPKVWTSAGLVAQSLANDSSVRVPFEGEDVISRASQPRGGTVAAAFVNLPFAGGESLWHGSLGAGFDAQGSFRALAGVSRLFSKDSCGAFTLGLCSGRVRELPPSTAVRSGDPAPWNTVWRTGLYFGIAYRI